MAPYIFTLGLVVVAQVDGQARNPMVEGQVSVQNALVDLVNCSDESSRSCRAAADTQASAAKGALEQAQNQYQNDKASGADPDALAEQAGRIEDLKEDHYVANAVAGEIAARECTEEIKRRFAGRGSSSDDGARPTTPGRTIKQQRAKAMRIRKEIAQLQRRRASATPGSAEYKKITTRARIKVGQYKAAARLLKTYQKYAASGDATTNAKAEAMALFACAVDGRSDAEGFTLLAQMQIDSKLSTNASASVSDYQPEVAELGEDDAVDFDLDGEGGEEVWSEVSSILHGEQL